MVYAEIVLLPLYPQYSTTTTKSSIEDFIRFFVPYSFGPIIRYIESFYKNDAFNSLIIKELEKNFENKDGIKSLILFFQLMVYRKKLLIMEIHMKNR